MTKKVRVEVLGAVVDGNASGSTLEIEERSAKAMAARGYVEILGEVKKEQPAVKKESAPKKPQEAEPKEKPKKSTKK